MDEKPVEPEMQPRNIPTAEEPEEDNRFMNSVSQNGANGFTDGTENLTAEQNIAMDYDAMPFEGDDNANSVGIKEDG